MIMNACITMLNQLLQILTRTTMNNDLNSDRKSSLIAREIIDFVLSLKSDKNNISISL